MSTLAGTQEDADTMAVTIRDVAARAGVGRGTVSRVLNDSPRVAPDTRARVLAAIAELDYEPNPTARRLSLGTTHTIGVVVPFLTRPSVVERLRGVEFALARTEYDLVVFNVETSDRRDALLADLGRRARMDGVILVSLAPSARDQERLSRSGVPVVLVDSHHRRLPRIVVDDVAGGRLATRHLLDLGHRRIAFVGDRPAPGFRFSSSRHRALGFHQAVAAAGLELPAAHVVVGPHSRHVARELALRLFALDPRPTGIVCASDTQALGVLEAAREAALRVPDDLSVVGYDDIEIAAYLGLTTVRQPLFESGVRGAQRLLEILRGEATAPLREVQDVELVVRETTAAPRDA